MMIAINGSLGSGKSTVAKKLAEKLGYAYVSTGVWFRELAKERGMNVIELNHAAEEDKKIDEYIDSRLKALNDSKENLIIDSRMAPVFIPNAIKIRLTVSDEEGARRIFRDTARGQVEHFADETAAIAGFRERAQSEGARYLSLYQVNLEDESLYDLIIDTSNISIDEVLVQIEHYVLSHSS